MTIKGALDVVEITSLGLEVFNDKEQFLLWLDSEITSLGKRKPKTLLKTKEGRKLVLNVLTALSYGNFI